MMENKKFDKIQTTILKLVEKDLFGSDYTPDEVTDWQAVFRESRLQAVVLSVYNAAGNCIPEELVEKLEITAVNRLQKNIKVHQDHATLHKLMTKNEIPYCILKGCASSYYYPDFCLRTMGDVDFLIRKEDIPRATQVLKDAGFEPWEEEHICHIVFRKGKMHLEMHFEPAGMPDGKAGELVRRYLEDIFEKSEQVQKESAVFRKPSDFHHGLVILMHTYHHLLSEGVGLRHLSDLAVFFDHFSDEEFKNLFYEKLSELGLWRFAQIMACVSHQYLGLPYRSWMGEVDEKLCTDVLNDILNGGNFGKKDHDNRVDQGKVISNRGKSGVEKSSFAQMSSVLNESASKNFPFLYKVKILRPLGWTAAGIRIIYNMITGKRRMIKVDTLFREADRRKEIYKQFQLFETGEK